MQLSAEQLVILRAERPIIDRLSFDLKAGDALLLTGPNGAGKTTLLRGLAGVLPLASGTVRLSGGRPERTLAEQAHVVGHLNAVKASLTVGENLSFWAGYLGGADGAEARAAAALERFGLDALQNYPAGELSAGQKRRLGLARVLAAERPIWLLDEPSAALDAAASELLADVINAHTAKGGLVIAATHAPLGIERAWELRLKTPELPA